MPINLWSGSISGHVTSILTILNIDKNILEALIPKGTRLANTDNANEHPVYFSFNLMQNKVTTPIPGYTLKYREMVVGITNVQLENSTDTTLYTYSPILYLNSLQGVLGGRIFYDLPKKFASFIFDTKDEKYQFSAHTLFMPNDVKFESQFEKDGLPMQANQSPNFEVIKPILQQPLIIYDKHFKFRSCEYKILGLDTSSIQPMTGKFQTVDFKKGLNQKEWTLQSINATQLGTFGINYDWQLTKPQKI